MKKHYLIEKNRPRPKEINVYSRKSAMVIASMLQLDSGDTFGVRETQKRAGVSLGLTQKIFTFLEYKGFIQASGQRTAKVYKLKNAELLLAGWINFYNVLDRCKLHNYKCSRYSQQELLEQLEDLVEGKLALHSACRLHGKDLTNLKKVEFYIEDISKLKKLEKKLDLEKVDSGYDLLLVEPYYKIWPMKEEGGDWSTRPNKKDMASTSALLSMLDLFHFPLRGREQAEGLLFQFCQIKGLNFKKVMKAVL